MLHRIARFLNRPLSGDFSFRPQLIGAVRGGAVVFGVMLLFTSPPVTTDRSAWFGTLLLLTVGVSIAAFVAGYVVPKLLPGFYDETRWTVWKYGLHVPMLLLLVSISNQTVLWLTGLAYPSFGAMYLNVLAFGVFPVSLDILLAEQQRLRRTLAHAQALNAQLPSAPTPAPVSTTPSREPEKIVLSSENERDRLLLRPDQLRYVESVGNYVEVHWLNASIVQKTVLRTTLKDVATRLASYPQFLRCHRAFLVNLTAVTHTEGNARGYQLTLADIAAPIPVSRSYLDAFDDGLKAVH